MDKTKPSLPCVAPAIPVVRPGISQATLEANGVRWLLTKKELAVYGFKDPGILILYRSYPSMCPMRDGRYIFARERYKVPQGKKKYHQIYRSGLHIFVPAGLPDLVAKGCTYLVIVEGEFKAMSLVEAGIPAVGMSGFYGYRYSKRHDLKGQLHEELALLIKSLKPKQILFLGDNDTALNQQWADAAIPFANLVPEIDVRCPRIPLGMPKGIDDVRELLKDNFASFWEGIVKTAVPVSVSDTVANLAEVILRGELDNIRAAAPEQRNEYYTKLAKLTSFSSKDDRQRFVNVAVELGLTEVEFGDMIRQQWDMRREAQEQANLDNKSKVFNMLMERHPETNSSLVPTEAPLTAECAPPIPPADSTPPPPANTQAPAPSTAECTPPASTVEPAQATPITQPPATDDPEDSTKGFPIDKLPPAFTQMALELARCNLVPDALPGSCMLGIISAAIGKGLQIQSLPNRKTPANLYVMGSAESGTGKSLTFNRVVEPFVTFERAYAKHWETHTKPRLKVKKDLLKGTIENRTKQLLKGEFEGELREKVEQELVTMTAELDAIEQQMEKPALSVEDVTVEKLAMMLSKNGECLANLSADAGANINNILGRYNKLERTDEHLYLKAFSWDSVKVDRVSRPSIQLEKPCLALLWLVQPDKVETILDEPSLIEGGLIPRMMICDTKCEPKELPEETPAINPAVATAYDTSIYTLIKTFRLNEGSVIIQPGPGVAAFFRDHFNRLVKRRRTDLRDVNSFAARWTEWAWRIAACLHAATHLEAAANLTLSIETAKNAATIADWFAEQVLSVLWSKRQERQRELMDRLSEILSAKPEGVSARDLLRARIASRTEEAAELLGRLEVEGMLISHDFTPATGGHKTRLFKVRRSFAK